MSVIQESKKHREVLREHSLVLCVDTSGMICVALKGTFCLLMLCNSWPSNRTDSTPCYRAVNKKPHMVVSLLWTYSRIVLLRRGDAAERASVEIPPACRKSTAGWYLIAFTECYLQAALQLSTLIQMKEIMLCSCFSLYLSIICELFHSSKTTILNVTRSRLTKMVESSLSLSALRAKSLTPFQI